MRGEPHHFEAQVRVAGIGRPRPGQRNGLHHASVERGPAGVEGCVVHAQPVRVRR